METTMTKTLKTMTVSAALAALFLSAGAFAGANSTAPMVVQTNVTIIHKNSPFPMKGRITADVCAFKGCIDV
jgi:hypothetical protein